MWRGRLSLWLQVTRVGCCLFGGCCLWAVDVCAGGMVEASLLAYTHKCSLSLVDFFTCPPWAHTLSHMHTLSHAHTLTHACTHTLL